MKRQNSPLIKVYLIRGVFYVMLLGDCAIPFALAQQNLTSPRPQLHQHQRATVGFTPSQDFGIDESLTWQNNTVHDGFDPASPLIPPLTLKWSHDFSGSGVNTISYPLIAQGLVIVTTAATGNGYGNTLVALDENTGTTVWSVDIPGTYFFANGAYDSGRVFVVNFDGLMKAFDAATGTLPGVSVFRVNTLLHRLQPLSAGLCMKAAPEKMEPFMPSMRRMEKCSGRCPWRTVTTAHRRLLKERFSFLTPARRSMLLMLQPVSNCGITQALAQTAAKEAAARRPWYMQGKCMSVTTFVTRQMALC